MIARLKQWFWRKMREAAQRRCPHTRTTVEHYGETGMLGTVICLDCGYTREWNAY